MEYLRGWPCALLPVVILIKIEKWETDGQLLKY